MPITKQLARQYKFEINDGTESVPDWVVITGVNTWAHNPSKSNADTTTFDEEGVESHLPASRGASYTFGGLVKYDATTGDRDPGQAAVARAAVKIGPEGLVQFRITEPGAAGDQFTFWASVSNTVGGGGNNDPSAWSVTVDVSGAITVTSGKALPAAPTAVAGTTDDEQSIVSWTDGAGGPFELYEVAVLDDGDEVDRIQSSAKPVLVAGLDNGTAYTFQVRARNSKGWGPLSTASSPVTPTA